jgi:hypothetical protein
MTTLTLVLLGPHDAAASLRVALAQRHGWRSDAALVAGSNAGSGDATLRAPTPDALDARIMHAECDRDAAALAAAAAAPYHRVVCGWHLAALGAAQLRATDADAWGALHACTASAVADYAAARPNTLLLVQPLVLRAAAAAPHAAPASSHATMSAPHAAEHSGVAALADAHAQRVAALALAHASALGLSVLPAVACSEGSCAESAPGLGIDAVADRVLANVMRAAMMAATSSAADAAQLAQSLLGAAYVQKVLLSSRLAATATRGSALSTPHAGADAYGGLAGAGSCGTAEAARMAGVGAMAPQMHLSRAVSAS